MLFFPFFFTRSHPKSAPRPTRSLVAVVFVGGFLGYLLANAINSFFVPTWALALAGGGLGGYTGG